MIIHSQNYCFAWFEPVKKWELHFGGLPETECREYSYGLNFPWSKKHRHMNIVFNLPGCHSVRPPPCKGTLHTGLAWEWTEINRTAVKKKNKYKVKLKKVKHIILLVHASTYLPGELERGKLRVRSEQTPECPSTSAP